MTTTRPTVYYARDLLPDAAKISAATALTGALLLRAAANGRRFSYYAHQWGKTHAAIGYCAMLARVELEYRRRKVTAAQRAIYIPDPTPLTVIASQPDTVLPHIEQMVEDAAAALATPNVEALIRGMFETPLREIFWTRETKPVRRLAAKRPRGRPKGSKNKPKTPDGDWPMPE